MRIPILTAFITTLVAASTVVATTACKCNPNDHSETKQRAAIKDFANLFLVQKNITKAFDEYIPG